MTKTPGRLTINSNAVALMIPVPDVAMAQMLMASLLPIRASNDGVVTFVSEPARGTVTMTWSSGGSRPVRVSVPADLRARLVRWWVVGSTGGWVVVPAASGRDASPEWALDEYDESAVPVEDWES